MKIRLFFYVSSKRCRTVHIQYGPHHSEGKTACGRVIVAHKWFWFRKKLKREQICTQCEAAA